LKKLQEHSSIVKKWIYVVIIAMVTILLLYQIPWVKSKLSWRIDEIRARVQYFLSPPDEAILVMDEAQQIELIVQATFIALTQAVSPTATDEILMPATNIAETPTPTSTSIPLPSQVILENVQYVDQHNRWNYCGPANTTMALNYWGWGGTRDDVAKVIKPGENDPSLDFITAGKSDKNVMPYEMVGYVNDHTEFSALNRVGGNIELLKQLLANGFPVVVEKGYYEADYTGKVAWLGHYLFVTGYDTDKEIFIVQDAYLKPGENLEVPFDEFVDGWRSFNYQFIVVYQPADEADVLFTLGAWASDSWANQQALTIANNELGQLEGMNEFFAWFNKGSSHVLLQEYVDASFAYDYALFVLYENLSDEGNQRPYRIMWYQTGPYFAYYYAQRYQDVINLANNTLLETISTPTLEESLYWRGRAYQSLGLIDLATEDFLRTVYLNKNFSPGWEMLTTLGVTP
jgi:tetratricopeptide (TPR) repeat protein